MEQHLVSREWYYFGLLSGFFPVQYMDEGFSFVALNMEQKKIVVCVLFLTAAWLDQ